MRSFFTLAVALVLSVTPASAATISFIDLLTSGAFTTYTESDFTVSAISGSWESKVDFGNPAPFIWFNREAEDPDTTAQIEITQGGLPFAFTSADLYSSLTTIPFVFSGFFDQTPIFTITGTVPNTFGNFETVNVASGQLIDTLLIMLSNPATPCCPNPVGIDNIVLNIDMEPIPEPATLLLCSTALAFVGARWRMRRRA